MWLNMNCLCAIYVDRNQRTFFARMTSFVVRYDVIYHFFPEDGLVESCNLRFKKNVKHFRNFSSYIN